MKKVGIRAAIVSVAGVLAMPVGLAQGCAMCRSTLEAQNETVTGALQLGILVLLIPPLAIMGTFIYIAFRKEDEAHPTRP